MNYVAAFVGGTVLYAAGVIAEREGFSSSAVMILIGAIYLYVAAIPQRKIDDGKSG